MERLTGVIAPIHTPFDSDGGVVSELFAENALRLLNEGCVALAPFGTTGEALSVGMAERKLLLENLIEGGVDPARLIPGTGLTNLPDTAELTRHAIDLGCHGAMTLPPFYIKGVSDEGLYAYFSQLIDWVGRDQLRLYLYHIPRSPVSAFPFKRLRGCVPRSRSKLLGLRTLPATGRIRAACSQSRGLWFIRATNSRCWRRWVWAVRGAFPLPQISTLATCRVSPLPSRPATR